MLTTRNPIILGDPMLQMFHLLLLLSMTGFTEVVKIRKPNRNKGYNINKLTRPPSLRLEEIPPTSTIPPQPIYHPLTAKQKEKMKEVLDIKYKELEESKPILEVLENYVIYKKKLDEILIGKERLNKKEFSEEDKVGIIEHRLPKKMCDPGHYVLPVKINLLYKDLGLGDSWPYQMNLTMADNTQAKEMGEVKNVRIQIGYQAYVVDLLILDIPVDPEEIRHTYFPKPRSKSYVEAFETEGEDDWLGSFEVGRDKDGNMKYGPVGPSFIDIEDDMERALAMEAYFNPFKNVIMFKKLVDFLGSLQVQLKNLDWGNEGYGTYKKVDGDGDWYARFEIVTPSGRRFNRAFKTKTTTRKLSGKFKTEDVLRHEHILTLFEFAIALGLFTEEEVEHRLFEVYFGKLEVDDKQFDHKDYWTRVAEEGSREPRQDHEGLNSSLGDWNASLSEIERGNVWRDSMLMRNNYMLEHSMPILHHFANQGNEVEGSSRGAGFNDVDDNMDE
ncbi:hypothetical protein Tco_0800544 [Tanacetum coccineum]|uniref:Uncharacterized protein n=1 Tax=Tanacetum coccineum TaxID=301880 RepID=A0ABQ4ZWC5_9ASTR